MLLERTAKTLATMQRMDRYRGHCYNWYDTRSLKPLAPQYVSAVDSGNLAAHLLVLRQGLLELIEANLVPPRIFGGLCDTAAVLLDVARRSVAPNVLVQIEAIEAELANDPKTLRESVTTVIV